jgi:hypothetical protein
MSILFAILYAFQMLIPSQKTRIFLMVPILILYYATFILFGMEYDKRMIEEWKKKEKKVVEDSYGEFVRRYHNNKDKI